MNVPRRIIGTAILTILATASAIFFYPSMDFIQYVQPLMMVGMLSTLVLAGLSFYREGELNMHDKNILMNGFIIAILLPSFYTAGAFMHDSQTSWSGGEIHWHADFEILVENETGQIERVNLVDPGEFCETTSHESSYMCSINDRTGSTEYHEHNDNRIHLEGSFKTRRDASLAAFFEQFNGTLSNTELEVPTNEGRLERYEDEQNTIKVLVKKGVGNRYWCAVGSNLPAEDRCSSHGQSADNPEEYIISPYSRGANLDNIFIVYDSRTVEEALQDVREDGEYRGFGLLKSGEGYGG